MGKVMAIITFVSHFPLTISVVCGQSSMAAASKPLNFFCQHCHWIPRYLFINFRDFHILLCSIIYLSFCVFWVSVFLLSSVLVLWVIGFQFSYVLDIYCNKVIAFNSVVIEMIMKRVFAEFYDVCTCIFDSLWTCILSVYADSVCLFRLPCKYKIWTDRSKTAKHICIERVRFINFQTGLRLIVTVTSYPIRSFFWLFINKNSIRYQNYNLYQYKIHMFRFAFHKFPDRIMFDRFVDHYYNFILTQLEVFFWLFIDQNAILYQNYNLCQYRYYKFHKFPDNFI